MKLIIAFSFLFSAQFLMCQSISNEKLLHFSFDGLDDTLDLINGVEVNYIKDGQSSEFYSDTSIYGVENSSVFLTRTWIEISNHGLSLNEDSTISISFWINSPSPFGVEMHDFFEWNSIVLEHINSFMLVPEGSIDFWPREAVALHFVQIYSKGSYKLYINNVLEHEVSEGVDFKIANEPLKIGADYSNYSIDELIVYEGELSDIDIEKLYEGNVVLNLEKEREIKKNVYYNSRLETLEFPQNTDEFSVYDLNGNKVESGNGRNEVTITLSGVYLVVYTINGNLYKEKIII